MDERLEWKLGHFTGASTINGGAASFSGLRPIYHDFESMIGIDEFAQPCGVELAGPNVQLAQPGRGDQAEDHRVVAAAQVQRLDREPIEIGQTVKVPRRFRRV